MTKKIIVNKLLLVRVCVKSYSEVQIEAEKHCCRSVEKTFLLYILKYKKSFLQ